MLPLWTGYGSSDTLVRHLSNFTSPQGDGNIVISSVGRLCHSFQLHFPARGWKLCVKQRADRNTLNFPTSLPRKGMRCACVIIRILQANFPTSLPRKGMEHPSTPLEQSRHRTFQLHFPARGWKRQATRHALLQNHTFQLHFPARGWKLPTACIAKDRSFSFQLHFPARGWKQPIPLSL